MSQSESRVEDIKPQNLVERMIWGSITGTYIIFIFGAQYVVGSVLGWLLFFCLLLYVWIETEEKSEAKGEFNPTTKDDSTAEEQPPLERIRIPWTLWIWIGGMLVMELALIVGHIDFALGNKLMIKSSIGWAKGWALIALYPLAGCLPIRPEIIYRAICIACFHTLLLAPIFLLAPALHLPEVLYVSPLKAVGGPGPMFFDVPLYEIDGSTGDLRWRLFTPWGPALGFFGNVCLVLSLEEKNPKWRWRGIGGSLIMILICKSRLAQVGLVAIPIGTWFLSRLSRPFVLFLIGSSSVLAGMFAPILLAAFETFWDRFKGARAGSTRVRMALKRIAEHRWKTEAPTWGHGIVESGPHLVEKMPIGSHHTWYGLLFVKGSVGFWALAVPMLVTFFVLWVKSLNPRYPTCRVGLSMVMILFLYTFAENLEILVYLFWPGMIVMGIALREDLRPLSYLPSRVAATSGTISIGD